MGADTYVLVNEARDVQPRQTTAMLVAAALRRSGPVCVAGAGGMAFDEGAIVMEGVLLEDRTLDAAAVSAALVGAPFSRSRLNPGDRVLVRTNPARDPRPWIHDAALAFLDQAAHAGVTVWNAPRGLLAARDKLHLARLPADVQPRTLMSHDPSRLAAFVRGCSGGAVLKPASGTRGNDVFRIDAGATANLRQIIDVLLRRGTVVAQEYVPEASEGDTRVVVLDGAPLVLDGAVAAIRRIPAAGDFRSNLHAGGSAAPAAPDALLLERAARVASALAEDGIRLAGLDFVGGLLIEANVFSTGGLDAAARFAGKDFAAAVVERLLP